MQEAFFRDWGQYWNRVQEPHPEFQSMIQGIPQEWKIFQSQNLDTTVTE